MGRKSWIVGCLGFGLALGSAQVGVGQGLLPPAPGADLEQISRRMAEAVRDLVEDIGNSMGQAPNGQFVLRDAQELQRATGEWYASLRGTRDPYQIRRSYSGIDVSWHRLQGQLAAPGFATPAVAEEVRRVERADAAIHQALNLNTYPPNFEGAVAPTGLDETRRLAYTLAQGGERLASTIQATYGADPNSAPLVNESADLARMVDGFYDSLNDPANPLQREAVQQAFAAIIQKSNAFGVSLGTVAMPPPVRSAWDGYTTVHNLLRGNLGLANASIGVVPPPQNAPVGLADAANPAAQIGPWADGLDRQVDELFANFAPTAPAVPEGREMLGDLERLRNDVRNFRGDVARGLDPGRLAYEFRDVDADWQRLARRVNRIGRGRTGPNVQRLQQIGQTCEQIHRVLGMPGYPPVIQPY
jgi:hypothetical protein